MADRKFDLIVLAMKDPNWRGRTAAMLGALPVGENGSVARLFSTASAEEGFMQVVTKVGLPVAEGGAREYSNVLVVTGLYFEDSALVQATLDEYADKGVRLVIFTSSPINDREIPEKALVIAKGAEGFDIGIEVLKQAILGLIA